MNDRPWIRGLTLAALVCAWLTPAFGQWRWERGAGWRRTEVPAPAPGPTATDREQFRRAMAVEARGTASEAAEEYRRFLEAFPDAPLSPEARYRFAANLVRAGEWDRAYRAIDSTVRENPKNADFLRLTALEYEIAQALLYAGASEKTLKDRGLASASHLAGEVFERVVQHMPFGPLAPAAQYHVGECWMALHDYAQATLAYRKVLKEYPAAEAWTLRAALKAEIALFLLDGSGSYDLGKLERCFLDAKAAAAQDDVRFGRDEAAALTALGETCAKLRLGNADFYRINGKPAAAVAELNRLLRFFPESAAAAPAARMLAEVGGTADAKPAPMAEFWKWAPRQARDPSRPPEVRYPAEKPFETVMQEAYPARLEPPPAVRASVTGRAQGQTPAAADAPDVPPKPAEPAADVPLKPRGFRTFRADETKP